jgi:hypothetical protein
MADSLYDLANKALEIEIISAQRIAGVAAINPKFRPRELSELHGVDPAKAPEVEPASEALVRGVLDALGGALPVLSIQDWISRESARRGGKGQLAAAMLGIPHKGASKDKQYKALLRAIQRSAEATKQGRKEAHKGLSERYQELVANLPGAELGNPYVSTSVRGRAALRVSKAQLSILGDWEISKRVYTYAWKGTDLEPSETYARVWNYPASFLEETLADMMTTYLREADLVELSWLYGLSLIIELPRES